MRPELAKKYLLWFVLVLFTVATPSALLLLVGADISLQRWALTYFGMGLSCGVLALTIVLVSVIPDPTNVKRPTWLILLFIYSLVGYCVIPYLAMHADPRNTPMVAVSSGVLGVLFLVNIGLIAALQILFAIDKLGLDEKVLPTHFIFVFWLFLALVNSGNAKFIVISALIILATVPLVILAEVLIEKRTRAKIKRLGEIYS